MIVLAFFVVAYVLNLVALYDREVNLDRAEMLQVVDSTRIYWHSRYC